MALLWQVGPSCENSLDKLWPQELEEWLRRSLQHLDRGGFAEKLCSHTERLLKHAEDNWSKHRILLCVCHISRCVAEHSTAGGSHCPSVLLVLLFCVNNASAESGFADMVPALGWR